MSLKVLLIGALCLLATAESKATHSKSLKSEVDPIVSDITTCTPDCDGGTGTEESTDPNPGASTAGPVTSEPTDANPGASETTSTRGSSDTEESSSPIGGNTSTEPGTHSTGLEETTGTEFTTDQPSSTDSSSHEPSTDPNSHGPSSTDPTTEQPFPTDPNTGELVVNPRVCPTECGISSSKKRVTALLLKLINILGEEAKKQSLNVFVDVSLDRFQESRYGELTKSVAVILGNYEGSFTGALKYIVDSSYGYVDDSQTIDVDDAFEVIFNVESDSTSIKQSASQVLLVAVYAAFRIENTDVEFDDLGTFEGNFATDLRVLVELATAVVRQVEHNVDDDQIASTFNTLTSASFTVQVSGDVVTVESVDEGSETEYTTTDSETGGFSVGGTVTGGDVEVGETDTVTESGTGVTGIGGGDGGVTVSGSGGIKIGYGGTGYKWASARARDAPLFKKSVKAHSLKSKDHGLKSHAKTAKSHATLAKTHAKLAKAHEKSKSKSHLKSSKAHQKNSHHQKSSKAHQKSNHHQKSSKAHQKSKNHQNQSKSKNHHSKSKSHHASKSKGHTQKNKNQQKSKSHQ